MRSPALRYARANSGLTFRPDANTVLWLPGQDDAYSSTIRDRSGQGIDGTITGATWKNDTPGGIWYLDFDGNDLVKNSNQFRGSDTLGSLAVWFIAPAVAEAMMGAADEAGTANYFWFAIQSPNGELQIESRIANATDRVRADTDVRDGAWHLGVVTSNGSTWILYLDGVSDGATVVTGANTGEWFGDNATLDNFTLGVSSRSSNVLFFNGSLALARVWSVQLTATQILGIYNQERHLFGA